MQKYDIILKLLNFIKINKIKTLNQLSVHFNSKSKVLKHL